MNALEKLVAESRRLGLRKGESAKAFAKRDPKAAKQLAEFIKSHKAELVKSVAVLVK